MFERASGHKVVLSFQSGAVLPVKVKEGAQADLVVTTPATIDDLVAAGKLVTNTRVDFVRSGAGVAVRAGAPKPDVSTPEAFKSALLAAKSVGYSQGPSGVHFMRVVERLGIADQVKAKGVVPPLGTRVGTLIAKGEAEIGVQQITELLLTPGSASGGRRRAGRRRTSAMPPGPPRTPRNGTRRPGGGASSWPGRPPPASGRGGRRRGRPWQRGRGPLGATPMSPPLFTSASARSSAGRMSRGWSIGPSP